ncbi:MAG: c-type cytochrome biogenesis protein CcsB [Alphaproteobacteria bacterium]|jgi:cytochrome c-type biogenesis protein CcsB|nr:c-type cytochrome biogenesis protein CcsB [Alphaproteobacteria bacterium]
MTIINDYQLPIIACFCLFFAMIAYWISLSFTKNNLIFQFSKVLVGISNLLFMATLSIRWISQGYFPLSNLYESLIFLSWGISFIHLIVEYKTQSRLIGAISTPLLFFLSGFSSLTLPTEMQKALPLVPSLQSNWLMMHVSMMMVSYATLILGSLLSILYLAFVFFSGQTNDVKLEVPVGESATAIASPVSSSKLSLLQTVDIWSYRIIGLGFPFLTIGIISGAVWANEAWGSYWSWDPKETWALITWLVFAIYLHSRLLKGWQGKQAAILGSCGFFVIWICYLGVNFLGKGLHSYGWVL